jgi:hypothetical protein
MWVADVEISSSCFAKHIWEKIVWRVPLSIPQTVIMTHPLIPSHAMVFCSFPQTCARHTCGTPSESPFLERQQRWANRVQGRRTPPRILHTNYTHARPQPYLLRWLQSAHFSTLLHTVFSHIHFVKHDDEIPTSATHNYLSLRANTVNLTMSSE